MPTPWQRDLERDGPARGLAARRLPDAQRPRASPSSSRPQSSGFSNETLLFELAWSEAGAPRREPLVVRIQPTGYQVFPEYDLGLQFRTMQLLAKTDVPVPRVLWIEEEDREVFGAPFYVMARSRAACRPISRRTTRRLDDGDRRPPSAPRSGGAASRAWRASTASTPRPRLRLPRPPGARRERARAAARLLRALPASGRRAGRAQPIVEAALAGSERTSRPASPTVLVWGDARIGNIIFDGTSPWQCSTGRW